MSVADFKRHDRLDPPHQRIKLHGAWTGECLEWQRELTVNQPPHGFEGSSPSSPTTLRPRGLRVAPPRMIRQGEACPAQLERKRKRRRTVTCYSVRRATRGAATHDPSGRSVSGAAKAKAKAK